MLEYTILIQYDKSDNIYVSSIPEPVMYAG